MKKQNYFKDKILIDARKPRGKKLLPISEKERQKIKETFNRKYDKVKHWEPSQNPNMNKFFSLSRELFQRGELSLTELAVYPVLCENADYKRRSMNQISLEIIGKKANLSVPTVAKAIDALCERFDQNYEEKLLLREKHTEGQRTFWLYDPWFIRESEIEIYKSSEQFFFHAFIIESGIWSNLDRRAKALYLGMRSKSEFDFMEYCDAMGLSPYEGSKEIIYTERKFEVCRFSVASICKMIGMDFSNMRSVINQLIEQLLIEEIEGGYIVYQFPNLDNI